MRNRVVSRRGFVFDNTLSPLTAHISRRGRFAFNTEHLKFMLAHQNGNLELRAGVPYGIPRKPVIRVRRSGTFKRVKLNDRTTIDRVRNFFVRNQQQKVRELKPR